MNIFNLTNSLSIDLDSMSAFERDYDGSTIVYIDLGERKSVPCPIPFDIFRDIIKRRTKYSENIGKNLEQLARYQSFPTP